MIEQRPQWPWSDIPNNFWLPLVMFHPRKWRRNMSGGYVEPSMIGRNLGLRRTYD